MRHTFPVASYVILMRGDNVLLSLRKNTGYMDGHYSLVAGHLDGNETASQAMIREASEEAGITIEAKDLEFACVMHRLSDGIGKEYIDFFFVCCHWSGEIENKEPQKCGGLDFFDFDNLPETTLPYIREALDAYRNGTKYIEKSVQQANQDLATVTSGARK